MSQISRKNSFGKVVFPFLVGNVMSRNRNCFFGRHFVIVYPIFNFFAVFWFFWITLSVTRISPPNLFEKVLFWVRVHRDPPLTTNGSAEGLDHLSVKKLEFCLFPYMLHCIVISFLWTVYICGKRNERTQRKEQSSDKSQQTVSNHLFHKLNTKV